MKKVWDKLRSVLSAFDARDIFVLCGFCFLYAGLSHQFSFSVANIATGAIILIKGLVKWV